MGKEIVSGVRDDLKDLFKGIYYYELDRHEKIRSSLVMPITILSIIIGAMLYYVKNPPHLPSTFLSYIFAILFLVLWSLIFQAIYFLIRAIYGLDYGYISKPQEIKDYFDGLEEFYTEQVKTTQGANEILDSDLRGEMDAFLADQYCEYAQVNTTNNDIKSDYRHKAMEKIIIVIAISAIIFVFFDLMPFLYHLVF